MTRICLHLLTVIAEYPIDDAWSTSSILQSDYPYPLSEEVNIPALEDIIPLADYTDLGPLEADLSQPNDDSAPDTVL